MKATPDNPKTEIELEIASKNYLDCVTSFLEVHKYLVCEFRDRGTRKQTVRPLFQTDSKSSLRIWMDLNSLKPTRISIHPMDTKRFPNDKAFIADIILERA